MGLSLLNALLKSNFRMCKPKLLRNCFGLNTQELRCDRLMSNYLHKTPIETSKKVCNVIITSTFSSFFSTFKPIINLLKFHKNYK